MQQGGVQRIFQQRRHRHRTDTAWYRGNPACAFGCGGEINVAADFFVGQAIKETLIYLVIARSAATRQSRMPV
jgi:hypothetical protein